MSQLFNNIGNSISKAYEEGIYGNTSQNRKLGRVGQRYSEEKITAEDILKNPEIIKQIDNIGGKEEREYWIQRNIAKTKNYKPDTYYRVESGISSSGYAGVGNGLYLGRDKKVLLNFYGDEDGNGKMSEFKGNPKWLDLIEQNKFKEFKQFLKNKKINLLNSDEVGEIVKKMGYDGIRYYDSFATGEEFVLFNTDKIKKIESFNIEKFTENFNKKTSKIIRQGLFKEEIGDKFLENREIAYSYLRDLAKSLGDDLIQYDHRNHEKHSFKYFQMHGYLESGNILHTVFIVIGDNNKVDLGKSNIKLLNKDFDEIKIIYESK